MRFAMLDNDLEHRNGEIRIVKRYLWFPMRIDGKYQWLVDVYVKEEIKKVSPMIISTYNRTHDWVFVKLVTEQDYVIFQRNRI